LAIASHLRIASDNANMGLPEVTLGVIPGYGGTQRLPQLIGKGRANELIMTAQMIDAPTALSYGLINHMVAQPELLDKANELALKIAKNAPVRSEEHTSELSHVKISYAVFCLKKKKNKNIHSLL